MYLSIWIYCEWKLHNLLWSPCLIALAIHTHTHTQTYTHIRTHTNTHIHTLTHTHTHSHRHTHTQFLCKKHVISPYSSNYWNKHWNLSLANWDPFSPVSWVSAALYTFIIFIFPVAFYYLQKIDPSVTMTKIH